MTVFDIGDAGTQKEREKAAKARPDEVPHYLPGADHVVKPPLIKAGEYVAHFPGGAAVGSLLVVARWDRYVTIVREYDDPQRHLFAVYTRDLVPGIAAEDLCTCG